VFWIDTRGGGLIGTVTDAQSLAQTTCDQLQNDEPEAQLIGDALPPWFPVLGLSRAFSAFSLAHRITLRCTMFQQHRRATANRDAKKTSARRPERLRLVRCSRGRLCAGERLPSW
jgi:hypothetical protein